VGGANQRGAPLASRRKWARVLEKSGKEEKPESDLRDRVPGRRKDSGLTGDF